MYKLYEYKYTIQEEHIGIEKATEMQYITNKDTDILYCNLDHSKWIKSIGGKLLLDDDNLKFIKNISKKEFEELVFMDAI